MKILHLSKMDSGGGAADGFVRIHRALLAEGHESVAYVIKQKRRDVPAMVDARGLLGSFEKLAWGLGRVWAKLSRLHLKPVGVYDFDAEANFPSEPIIRDARARAEKWDLVLVHWSGAFVRPETIREIAGALGARVALWQVDMAHATGGCHYPPPECDRYAVGCGRCPLIASRDDRDISATQARERRKVWEDLGAVVLAPSSWSADNARHSLVLQGLQLHTFPIPLDLAVLNPLHEQTSVRARLGLPMDGRIVLVRALSPSIPYKSFGLFQAALSMLDEQGVRLHVLAIGEKGYIPGQLKHITHTDLGAVKGDSALAEVYRASDFFVSCSIQDAGPMMIGEAMACGRPSIAYPIGIAPDLIEQGCNGTLVEPVGDVASLASALRAYAEMPAAELAARQQAAADSAGRIFSAGYFAQQVQAALRR
jgi:glycosyltransferase involved in cell wall biosynthesis